MNLKQLFTDDDAVSPVIGVILMVAITVILAAVIGAFVLDIGGSQESAPQVQWDWSDDAAQNDTVLSHGGGDTVNNPSQLSIDGDVNTSSPDYSGMQLDNSNLFGTGSITANDEATIEVSADSTGTVYLTWESSDGSQSSELSSHDYDTT